MTVQLLPTMPIVVISYRDLFTFIYTKQQFILLNLINFQLSFISADQLVGAEEDGGVIFARAPQGHRQRKTCFATLGKVKGSLQFLKNKKSVPSKWQTVSLGEGCVNRTEF